MDTIYDLLWGHEPESPIPLRFSDTEFVFSEVNRRRHSWEFESQFRHMTESERTKFVLEIGSVNMLITKLVKQFRSDLQDGTKSTTQANSFIAEGKKAFDNDHFDDAIKMFTNAIRYAPQGDTALSLAYGYRSAVYFRLQHYENAIKDIDAALRLNKSPIYPLILCKCKCLRALGRVTEAEQVIQDSSQHFPLNFASSLDRILRGHSQIETGPNINESVYSELLNNVSSVIKMLSEKGRFQSQSTFSSLSAKVKVQYDKVNGHHLVATEDIQFGDILAVTKPYASVMIDKQDGRFCHHCLVALKLPGRISRSVPCGKCSRVVYCSEKCRSDSWKSYHRIECPLLPLATTKSCRDQYLAFRTFLISGGLNSIRDIVAKCKARPEHQLIEFTGNLDDYENICQLTMTTKKDRDPKYHHQQIEDIIVLGFLAKLAQSDSPGLVSEQFTVDEIQTTEVLLRHLAQIRANGWLIPKCTAQSTANRSASHEFFSVLDPLISLLNSSCRPNISIITVDSDLINDDRNPNRFGSNVLLFFAHQPIKANSVLSAMLPWTRCEETLCKCHLCRREQADTPYVLNYKEYYEIGCDGGCDGLLHILPPDQITQVGKHYKCSKCTNSPTLKMARDKFDRMRNFEEEVVRLLGQIEKDFTDTAMSKMCLVKEMLDCKMSPLFLPHNGQLLSKHYNQLSALLLRAGLKDNQLKFEYVLSAWKCIERSCFALDGQFGGDSEALLLMLREKAIDSFKPVVDRLSSDLAANLGKADDDEAKRGLVNNFRDLYERVQKMQNVYKLV